MRSGALLEFPRIRLTHIAREGRVTSHGAALSSYASGRILIQGPKM
jgi:hypothetical protein